MPTNGTDIQCEPCPGDDFECQLGTDLADIVEQGADNGLVEDIA